MRASPARAFLDSDAMRVLLVTHRFPPAHQAGTERHVEALARELAARGHEVLVLTAEKDLAQPDLSLRRRVHAAGEGPAGPAVQVVELIDNLLLQRYEETWDRPALASLYDEVLTGFRPEVVHVHHLMYGGVQLLERARARGAAVLMTLHDFWLECGRMGQLRSADGHLCEVVDTARCGRCLPSVAWRQPAGARTVARVLRGVRRWTGLDLLPAATRARRAAPPTLPTVDAEEAARFEGWARVRTRTMVDSVQRHAQRVVAPSAFLAARTEALGIPADRLRVVPTGLREVVSSVGAGEARSGPLGLLFLGTLVPVKGAHLLLDAWGRLGEAARGRGVLRIHGPGGHDPGYEARLAGLAAEHGVQIGGALESQGVQAALEAADLVVVPSLWFENRPTVVLEALAAGKPCLVADRGGMAELVREGREGWHFRLGDPVDLARALRELLVAPARVRALRPDASHLPRFAQTVDALLELYEESLEELGDPAGRSGPRGLVNPTKGEERP
jgi:glycosyltransferase involved in cell wall biosynthesis